MLNWRSKSWSEKWLGACVTSLHSVLVIGAQPVLLLSFSKFSIIGSIRHKSPVSKRDPGRKNACECPREFESAIAKDNSFCSPLQSAIPRSYPLPSSYVTITPLPFAPLLSHNGAIATTLNRAIATTLHLFNSMLDSEQIGAAIRQVARSWSLLVIC